MPIFTNNVNILLKAVRVDINPYGQLTYLYNIIKI